MEDDSAEGAAFTSLLDRVTSGTALARYIGPWTARLTNPIGSSAVARFVIDAATLLKLVDAELQVDTAHQLVAPSSIRSEALELLLREVRAGKRTEAAAMAAHDRMTEIKLRLLGDRVSRRTAWRLARQHGWDRLARAEYLAITKLQADALVTEDPGLLDAAHEVVRVAELEELLRPG